MTERNPGFALTMRQQPERARLCSFKEENDTIDRRPVDPPPVIELFCPGTDQIKAMESTKYFIRASIVHPQPMINDLGEEDYLPVKTPTGSDATAGEVIQTPERLKGLDGQYGFMAIFAKLSVRMPGIFRLKMTLYETTDQGVHEIIHIVSDTFEVFSPKLFKGMRESTPLTRHLASQGLKVKLRTDTTVGRQSDSRKRSHQNRTPVTSTPGTPSPPLRTASLPAAHTQFRAPNPQPHFIHPQAYANHPSSFAGPSTSATTAYPSGPPGPPPPSSSLLGMSPMQPPLHSANLGYRSAPPPPPGPSRSLVWHPNMNHRFPESSSSRGSSPSRPSGRFHGDDGFPSLRDISSRFDHISTPPSSDLSAFSLSQDRSSFSPSSSASSASHAISRPFSAFSSAPPLSSNSPYNTSMTSTRSSSPGMHGATLPPIYGDRLNLGPGDDGIPRLPSFLRSNTAAAPVLPPPLPSFLGPLPGVLGPGPKLASPPPTLPPIRHRSPSPEEPPPKR